MHHENHPLISFQLQVAVVFCECSRNVDVQTHDTQKAKAAIKLICHLLRQNITKLPSLHIIILESILRYCTDTIICVDFGVLFFSLGEGVGGRRGERFVKHIYYIISHS